MADNLGTDAGGGGRRDVGPTKAEVDADVEVGLYVDMVEVLNPFGRSECQGTVVRRDTGCAEVRRRVECVYMWVEEEE